MASGDYLLGHGAEEWSRLQEQHALWISPLAEALAELGLDAACTVIEPGCGSGALLGSLAEIVGPTGRAVGLERDPEAAAMARERLSELPQVQVLEGDLRTAPLPSPVDFVVCRWVLSFLPDADAQVQRMAGLLRPGGMLVVQDYNHDGMRIFPERPEIAAAVEAFRAAWRASGGDLWIAGRLPAMYARAGLDLAHIHPHAKAGPPGSPVWRWVERFLFEHVDKVVASGHLTPEARDAFAAAWAEVREQPGAVVFSPMQVVVAGMKTR